MGREGKAPSPRLPGLLYLHVQEEETVGNTGLVGYLKVMIEKEYPEYILAFDKVETLRNMKWLKLMK